VTSGEWREKDRKEDNAETQRTQRIRRKEKGITQRAQRKSTEFSEKKMKGCALIAAAFTVRARPIVSAMLDAS
jgi:hypothetical protein